MHLYRSLAALVMALVTFLLLGPSTATAEKRRSHDPAAGKKKRPNVVVVMTDDQDFRSMWAMPQVQELIGDQGTTFDNSWVNFPLCCPSRATFLTGQYAHNHDITWNNAPDGGYPKLDHTNTLPVWMQDAGYRTVHIGKYMNEYGERDPHEVPPGWSEWYGGVDPSTYGYYDFTINHDGELRTYGHKPHDYSTDVYARIAKRQIRESAQGKKPFFINIAPNAPHTVAVDTAARKEGTPAVPAPRDADVFAGAPIPDWPNFNEADLSDKPALELFFPSPLNADDIDSLTDHYDGRMGALLAVDDLVGTVEKQLQKQKVARDTVVIYTSDNGWVLGEHRLSDKVTADGRAGGVKFVPYETSARVPLMIKGPGFPAGEKVESPVINADLTRTITDIAGADPGLRPDGISLRRVAHHPEQTKHRAVLTETFENPRNVPYTKSIHTSRYRYDLATGGFEGLFDIKRDPWELQSVHEDDRYTGVKASLATELQKLIDCDGPACQKASVDPPKPTGEPLDPK
jgi:arylsulfatase A-like enzyme